MFVDRTLSALTSASAIRRAYAPDAAEKRMGQTPVEQAEAEAVRAASDSAAGPAARLEIQQRARQLAADLDSQQAEAEPTDPEQQGEGNTLLERLRDAHGLRFGNAPSNIFMHEEDAPASAAANDARDTTPLVDENVFIDPWPEGDPPTPLERAAKALGIDLKEVAGESASFETGLAPDADTHALETSDPEQDAKPEEQLAVRDLERRDREVRAHENAHKAAGGAHAGAVHLEFTSGPDGKRYATSGEVPIDVSPVADDPEATVRKMATVIRAANAPVNPSGPDKQIAAQAATTLSQARLELLERRRAEGAERVAGPERVDPGEGVAGPEGVDRADVETRAVHEEREPTKDAPRTRSAAATELELPRSRTHAVAASGLEELMRQARAGFGRGSDANFGRQLSVIA